jgi:hypothetical protein
MGTARKVPSDEAAVAGIDDEETRVFAGIAEENAGLKEVSLSGLEPETYGLKVRCSTD